MKERGEKAEKSIWKGGIKRRRNRAYNLFSGLVGKFFKILTASPKGEAA